MIAPKANNKGASPMDNAFDGYELVSKKLRVAGFPNASGEKNNMSSFGCIRRCDRKKVISWGALAAYPANSIVGNSCIADIPNEQKRVIYIGRRRYFLSEKYKRLML